jgi:predicted enzyme related to lactoylglutathione lyase
MQQMQRAIDENACIIINAFVHSASTRENSMRKTVVPALALLLVAPIASPADNSLNGVRIGAKDVTALARFYQAAFGMHEVQRMQNPQFTQIMLDFGATAEAAKANSAPDLVLRSRASDEITHDMGHVVFNVSTIDAAVTAVKAGGGRIEREPFAFGNTGIRIAMAIDPAGNHFELLQAAPR